jgi:hypothetical protein
MRIITLFKSGEWSLPVGLSGEEFAQFKQDYKFIISDSKLPASFDLDNLPELSDNLKDLKKFMSRSWTIEEWNTNRNIAKRRFTFTVIAILDASGFIKKVLS